ncbi:hypothetical protein JOJ86_002514 [Rhodococcus percolatus]|uniref:hypothetical protein n=1 Tax=Rhodococcus TaxID=1827 RepID=UPI0006BB4975|nr:MULTISPECIES: hypothetical protein [Rhodococcus]MBA8959223.1 hypothetical protein [Rhodococcus opacus]MBP2204788.1 hypothetical protein [Rhodococcus opacus]MDI9935224.1 hypothetical protein [Rhodococcus sp. IEGM 1351]
MLHHQLENPGTGRFLCTSPGRVAIAGDWHANTACGVVAIAHAAKRNADVLIHLGDFGFAFTDAYLDALDRALDDRLGRVTVVAEPAHPRAEELTERAGTGQSRITRGTQGGFWSY